MIAPLSLQQLAAELGVACAADALITGVSTDSRSTVAGDLYVALVGERFDGHDFIAQAQAKGAVAALVQREADAALPLLQVDDSRYALGLLARLQRRQHGALCLLALTGSAGKTSTKELLAAALAQRAPVLATRGNLNNEIGVPLTLLRLEQQHRYAVIEMGAARRGDIAYLCQFAEPDIALLTNALPAHLAGFGDLNGVAETKAEIFSALSAQGIAVINADSPFAPQWRASLGARQKIEFSLLDPAADVYAGVSAVEQGRQCFDLHIGGRSLRVRLQLLGRHNVANALAAAAAATAAGLALDEIAAGLASVAPVAGRLALRRARSGGLLIDDSYNANPGSVRAAIDTLVELSDDSCLVLATMAELGEQAEALHEQVAAYARERGVKQLLLLGDYAESQRRVFGAGALAFSNYAALEQHCLQQPGHHAVLIKGSRSMQMERLVTVLAADAAAGGLH